MDLESRFKELQEAYNRLEADHGKKLSKLNLKFENMKLKLQIQTEKVRQLEIELKDSQQANLVEQILTFNNNFKKMKRKLKMQNEKIRQLSSQAGAPKAHLPNRSTVKTIGKVKSYNVLAAAQKSQNRFLSLRNLSHKSDIYTEEDSISSTFVDNHSITNCPNED